MPITIDAVRAALSHVDDPDFRKDLVSLNMIKDIQVDGKKVSFTVELTTPACPMKDKIRQDCIEAVHTYVDASVEVIPNMSARVTTNRMQGDVLPGVRNTIAIASGKGGVGKSTLAVNMAVALAHSGASVGLVDTDIYGPSIPTMFGVPSEKPRVNANRKIVPIEKYGVKLLSMGFLVDPNEAVVWRGPMVTGAVRQFLGDTDWGELDYLIIDLPPGTGDIQLTLVQTAPITGAVIISTPQDVALADARKGVAMFNKVNVPVLGIVENMAYFTPPELPDRKYYLFGEGGARRLADELNLPLLGEVPIELPVREGGDEGKPVVLRNPGSQAAQALTSISERAAQAIAMGNANILPQHQLEVLQ